jgi:hypothetical protein
VNLTSLRRDTGIWASLPDFTTVRHRVVGVDPCYSTIYLWNMQNEFEGLSEGSDGKHLCCIPVASTTSRRTTNEDVDPSRRRPASRPPNRKKSKGSLYPQNVVLIVLKSTET